MSRPSLLTVSLVLLTAFWVSFGAQRYTQALAQNAARSSRRPFVLNGLTLPLRRHVSPSLDVRYADGRYLMLVSSDTCRYSQQEIGSFAALVPALRLRRHDSVLLLSMNGLDIPRQLGAVLKAGSVEYQTLRTNDKAAFVEETGLAWTPAVIVLDSNLRVRLAPERLDEVTKAMIVEYFNGPSVVHEGGKP